MKRKEIINEHDLTKKMLDTIRGINLIKEAEESGDTISPAEGDQVYNDEAKKIADTVDPRVQITKFKIYPKDRDVQFEGRLDSGINFSMSTKAMKLSISITENENNEILLKSFEKLKNSNLLTPEEESELAKKIQSGTPKNIFVDKDLLATLQKLNGYYENWTREWATKLNTEYKPK